MSDSGSGVGAATRGLVRSNVVIVTIRSALTSADASDQAGYTRVSAVRDEEASGSARSARDSAIPVVRVVRLFWLV